MRHAAGVLSATPVHAWFPSLRKPGFCNATRRNATYSTAGTCGLAEKCNTALIDCGTPAAGRWLPQALSLPTFFATSFV